VALGSNCGLLLKIRVQLVVSYTIIEAQIIFLSCFLCLLLDNLPLLTSLEERSTCKELDYFFGVEDRDGLEKNDLVNKAVSDVFALF